jgi:thioredoxin 1
MKLTTERETIMKHFVSVLAFTLMIAGIAHAELPSANDATVRQALDSGKPAVIDLGARYCYQCKKMAPILESLASEYRGRASVMFIDAHEDGAAAEIFKVVMIPTQIFFNAQGKEVKRHIGFMDKDDLIKELKALGVK